MHLNRRRVGEYEASIAGLHHLRGYFRVHHLLFENAPEAIYGRALEAGYDDLDRAVDHHAA